MKNHLVLIGRAIRQVNARLFADRRGVSAVEFALIAPVLVVLYLGLTEASQGIGIKRKVALTTHALSDLASNPKAGTSVNDAEMTNILNAAAAVMTPYPAGPLTVTVSAIDIDSNGKATVAWSDTLGGTARGTGSTVTIPSALAVPNSQLIFSEVAYGYTPAIGFTITGTLTLSDKLYMAPRVGTKITRQKT
jgi:Flp pilus assembly protein TadG